ncbi:hypothetical protein AMES_1134 [Amycolatopsis mediterranei S699]|uniref:DUF4350 domain-containing protein n=2 Tax=Amycolatopsis mediterranei TaxID=33910 RepID=A0A9R0NS61_AMYMS|nr:DUF4350 domain-containing protein [Amycolatopsis mediterranei]ADJ42956.1 putative secreted protein [Amycolatopsis mediterranei U32]AEK39651.1 hypothetical protein RAM_05795 [Amycolatopsis mediterranei S699]AFO74670.1 hypothetical protein AMES_1134 [Amycolatopsis mediterranei S699]AGT81799.1 hypothetical protein B737_1135 [Amycolatopsis mediterranei RB]KDO04376.1 hypothetical protein DV26_44260 [Amycolatopsis mediterranei]
MSTAVSPDLRRIWRGARIPLALLALIFIAGALLLLGRGEQAHGDLEPGSYEPGGAHALAKLLKNQGVDVRTVHTIAEADAEIGEDATLLVTAPDLAPAKRFDALRERAADVVLVTPGERTLHDSLPLVRQAGRSDVGTLPPQCTVAAAVAAGEVTLGGIGYASPGARSCYPGEDGGGTLLQLADGGGTTTLLGSPAPLTNARLAEQGNAALGLRLLGAHPKLVWYLPTTSDPALDGSRRSIFDLIPDGWYFGAAQAFVAVALLALWRARRLGPVVTEPLPIVVRAAETAEGRARLYRRAKAAGHAGETLREAARGRLRTALGLPRDADPAALVESVSTRTGRAAQDVGAVLYGPPVPDDPALVRLAGELDHVEREAGRT